MTSWRAYEGPHAPIGHLDSTSPTEMASSANFSFSPLDTSFTMSSDISVAISEQRWKDNENSSPSPLITPPVRSFFDREHLQLIVRHRIRLRRVLILSSFQTTPSFLYRLPSFLVHRITLRQVTLCCMWLNPASERTLTRFFLGYPPTPYFSTCIPIACSLPPKIRLTIFFLLNP